MLKSEKGRLTPAGVARVRALRAEGKTYQAIAEEMKICLTTVYNVCTKRRMPSAEVQPWERQDDEPEAAFEAFKGYCFQTPPRRIAHASVKHSTADISRLYNDFRWKERVLAWDRHIQKMKNEEREALLRQDEKDRLAKWTATLESAGEFITREMSKFLREAMATEFTTIRPSDLNKLMTTWITMQRLVNGESTENVATNVNLKNLSVDELRELQRLHAKIAGDEDGEELH